ncbi:hypothetical protein SAMN05444955_106108 [Lihuaxuella thermophila]|uniref:Uncharacterized protein n=1 Tax=Lihuaxuella thermophila TaxID=1173111 RepID=A0A1H8E2R5_9BACL|nr:hypothetical protein SAMN05444955_106108 [Lihuaxuella thermophila]
MNKDRPKKQADAIQSNDYTTEFSFEMFSERPDQPVTDAINESYFQYGIAKDRQGEQDRKKN